MMFRSLKHRNFRLYYFGQLISLQGTWMQTMAQAWLVYRLSHSAFWLGVIGFCTLFPVLLLSLIGGIVADHYPKRKLLIALHLLGSLQAIVLALLTYFNLIEVWHLIFFALFLGVLHAFEMPARHTFIVSLVPKQDLGNAIALNSSAFNSARLTGPALAGLIVGISQEAWVFFVNAISFLAIVFALANMQVNDQSIPRDKQEGLLYGFTYAMGTPLIRISLFIVSVTALTAATVTTLMPIYAAKIYQGNAQTLGYLLGALGAGALLGALHLASGQHDTRLVKKVSVAALLLGLFLTLFAWINDFRLALVVLLGLGYCQTSLVASSNTLVQLHVPNAIRGRVMSVFSMLFIGIMPIGSFLSGVIAEFVGVRWCSQIFALVCFICALFYLRFQKHALH